MKKFNYENIEIEIDEGLYSNSVLIRDSEQKQSVALIWVDKPKDKSRG
jgi:hypothetical protein